MTILRVPFRGQESPQQDKVKRRVDMRRVGTIILGGGSGTRLHPLTLTRCKPAISFGGRYRLIDIPMSNALNSGCQKIYILTQFLSASLHQHILKTYRMEAHSPGFIEILSAEQKPTKTNWYQGTADAIRQNVEYLVECDVDYFLILSGDQLYQMNFEEIVACGEETEADLVVAALPVEKASAKRMGVLKIDEANRIIDFLEKPQNKASLEPLRARSSLLKEALGTSETSKQFLGSMGIYLFRKDVLLELLHKDPREDFGKHLIPTLIQKGKSVAHLFPGYWEDIGTIESFYLANMGLTTRQSPFNFYDEDFPTYTFNQSLPPPRIHRTLVECTLLCEGAEVAAERISDSIIGPRSRIDEGSVIEASYLFGNDHYSSAGFEYGIGKNCWIRKAIIDKQVRIGDNVKLINEPRYDTYESGGIYIRDGILIVTRGAKVPDNFTL